jgi:predicted Zn-dependent protease
VKEETPQSYEEARKKLNAGEVKAALDLLMGELEARPKCRDLAAEVISLCEAAGLRDAARDLTCRAVEAGNEVPQLLLRRGDEVRAKDPAAAIALYRRAVQEPWQSAGALIKLGEAYAATGNRPVAESCWRRAHFHASVPQKAQIVRLFGLGVATEE